MGISLAAEYFVAVLPHPCGFVTCGRKTSARIQSFVTLLAHSGGNDTDDLGFDWPCCER
jgi:DNA-directed RNA polymerase subunit N (RpoN/RPB10)